MTFEVLEAGWTELRTTFEATVVGQHRGLPVDVTGYANRRRAFEHLLADAVALRLSEEERAGLDVIRAALPFLDEMLPPDGTGPLLDGAGPSLDGVPTEPPGIASLRRSTYDAYGEAAAAIRLGDQTVDRLTAFRRLATEPDPLIRRATFEAMAPIWRAVDGDGGPRSPYRRLLAASAARWARDGSPIDAGAAALGIEPNGFEPMLHEILAAGRRALATGAGARARIEPWDYESIVGEAERRVGAAIPLDRLRPINEAHLRSLGADPVRLRISYDIVPRPGRPVIPVAFTMHGDPGPWVFATYTEGGLGNLAELLHESGHAIHEAAIRTRSAFAYPPAQDAAFFEAIAELVGWDATEPSFLEHHLGMTMEPRVAGLARYGGVLLDVCWALFEIELHRAPGRRPNDVWATIVGDGLGLEPHPEWSWWAVRGQLIDSPGYLANYPLGAIVAAALRSRIRQSRGDWSRGDPGWYATVSERLLRFGGERRPAALIADMLGGPATVRPILADLAGVRAG